jgi:transcriptional regulator with XRE-family HTH domain
MLVVGKRTVPIVISEIARATDLSIAHVSRVFGSKRVPSMKTAKKISQHLHVSLDQLYAALNLQ